MLAPAAVLRLLLASALLVGCADSSDGPAATPTPAEPAASATPDTAGAAPAPRPETATATLSVEGTEEPVDLRLVTFDDVPLPFSTYVPAEWSDDAASSGEGTAVRFETGPPGARGVLTVFVPSEPNRGGIEEIARSVAESTGDARPLEPREPWARSAYAFQGDGETGQVRVGEHAGVPFYVVERYPYEMGDGFAPRAALVLDRWRWADDGAGL